MPHAPHTMSNGWNQMEAIALVIRDMCKGDNYGHYVHDIHKEFNTRCFEFGMFRMSLQTLQNLLSKNKQYFWNCEGRGYYMLSNHVFRMFNIGKCHGKYTAKRAKVNKQRNNELIKFLREQNKSAS